jgi:hypothetical protein
MEKALSAGPLLVLDVPMTKNGSGCLILICPMLHVYQPKEIIAMILSQIPQDMFQDYVVRFSKKLVILPFCGGKLGTPTRLSNFVPRTVAWYGYTCNNVVSIPMPYKKDKL